MLLFVCYVICNEYKCLYGLFYKISERNNTTLTNVSEDGYEEHYRNTHMLILTMKLNL